jgi:hypothetical protein
LQRLFLTTQTAFGKNRIIAHRATTAEAIANSFFLAWQKNWRNRGVLLFILSCESVGWQKSGPTKVLWSLICCAASVSGIRLFVDKQMGDLNLSGVVFRANIFCHFESEFSTFPLSGFYLIFNSLTEYYKNLTYIITKIDILID